MKKGLYSEQMWCSEDETKVSERYLKAMKTVLSACKCMVAESST